MNVYEIKSMAERLSGNTYPGRGIVLGVTPDGKTAVAAYFIMGRSVNSRNRVFVQEPDGIRTEAFDPSLMKDPHLIIYHPVREAGQGLIVTNGDQTDTVWEYLSKGESWEAALRTRQFEDDAPNWTPRISGLQAGDEIVAVNGRRCFVANDILYELVRTEAYRARFTVKRDGQKVELPDVQFDTWQDDKGETHMSLGFTVYGIRKTPLNVLKEAGNSVLYYGRIIFASLSDLLRGRESINDLSGPVGIVTAIGQAASYGWQDLLELLVLITVNLGIFNLLPFPALDGGKVVFLAIEGITGHAVPEKLQGSLTVAAFALLFGLMIFATYNDIIRLITGAV